MFERITYIAEVFFLNPGLFFKKIIGKMLIKFAPAPEGERPVKISAHTIIVWPARNIWWKSMYLGCCDVEIEQNLKRYLPESGVFIDVGAGVGYFSALASKIIGSAGRVYCFEPHPSTARAIRKMIDSNPNSNIVLNDCALGADDSTHNYYIQRFNGHTEVSMVANLLGKAEEVIKVRTRRLDDYLKENRIDEVSLIKIDVEGFEYFVLKGLEGYFKKSKHRSPIICEISPSACARLGYTLKELCGFMADYGYQAYNIFNSNRKENIELAQEEKDVVFRAKE